MAAFLRKTIQQDKDTVSFTYRFRMPGEMILKEDKTQMLSFEESGDECSPFVKGHSKPSSLSMSDFDRMVDPNFDFADPMMLEHCDEVLRKAELFNETLRRKYGIIPEQYVPDYDTRPRFLSTPDKCTQSGVDLTSSESEATNKDTLRPSYTPYPRRSNRRIRNAARMVVRTLANPEHEDEQKYRVTSTISSIAAKERPVNPLRLVHSDPDVTRTSTIVSRSDVLASKVTSSTSSLASNLISLTHTGSSVSGDSNIDAHSSSAHSQITIRRLYGTSPTISDVIRFRNRVGMLSDFLRNPRHNAPKPMVRSDSEASTQRDAVSSSTSEN